MQKSIITLIIVTAAAFLGGGVASAQSFAPVVDLSAYTNNTPLGRGNTYVSITSEEWTPSADTILCQFDVTLSQATGNATAYIGWTIRKAMTTNPTTGGTVILSGVIAAVQVTTSPTTISVPFDTCAVFYAGTKYSFNFAPSFDDPTNYFNYYWGSDAGASTSNWDFVSVQGWTHQTSRELSMTLYGTDDPTLFNAYVSSTYGFSNPDFGTQGNMLIDIAKWLFVPNPNALNFLQFQGRQLLTKWPFGLFAESSSTLMGLNSGDSTTSTVISLTATTTEVHATVGVFDPTNIKAKIPQSVVDQIQALGGVLVWLLFFVWITMLASTGDLFHHTGFHGVQDDNYTDAIPDEDEWLAVVEGTADDGGDHDPPYFV